VSQETCRRGSLDFHAGRVGVRLNPCGDCRVVGVVALDLQRDMHDIGEALRRLPLRPSVKDFGRCIEREGNP
jgi:hypothetical protein